eukprot:sb/3473047/
MTSLVKSNDVIPVARETVAKGPGVAMETVAKIPGVTKEPASKGHDVAKGTVSRHFTTCHHDDIRSSGYRFLVEEQEVEKGRVEVETVVITPSTITWRYPEKRSLVSMVSLPVLMVQAEDDHISCKLRYLDEFTCTYKDHATFNVSQVNITPPSTSHR